MRIVHVLEAVGAGAGLHVKMLACAQQQAGDDVVVAAPSRRAWGVTDDDLIAGIRAGGVEVVEVPLHSLPIHPRNKRAARALSDLLAERRPDVVHSHSTAAGAIARIIARRRNVPTIHSPHGVRFASGSVGPEWVATVALERVLAPFTSRVIATSPSEGDVLARVYRRDRIAIVSNGVCVERLPSPYPDVPRIVSVHRLTYQKDPELGVDIMSKVRRARPNVEVVIVGDGPLNAKVRSTIDRVDPGIRLVTSERGIDAMAHATAVLLCSRWEGGPYVPLEAMSLARPVVASNVVGSRDYVSDEETGFLFDRSRPADAADRLVQLVDDPELTAVLGSAGRRVVAAHYGLDQMVGGVREVYEAAVTTRL